MYQLKLGVSIGAFDLFGERDDFFDRLKEIKKQGFYSVEVSFGKGGCYKVSMERVTQNANRFLGAVLDEGLVLNSVHLPFSRFCYFSSSDEGVRAFASEEMQKLIAECDKFSPKHYILHSKTGTESEGLWAARVPALIKTAKELVTVTKNNICLENMVASFPRTAQELASIVDEVKGARVCVDTNHFLKEKTQDAIATLGKRIATIHVSDHDYVYEKHWLPKEGKIDWMKVLGALEKVGYNGVFNYEVKQVYSYQEIRANYESLFEEYNK